MAEFNGKLKVKAGNGKGFKIEGYDGWFNASDKVVPYLEKIEVGTEVVVIYKQDGIKRIAEKVSPASTVKEKEQHEEKKSEFTCEVCGASLKDGKYKVCYMCNKKGAKKSTSETKKSSTSNTNTDDRTAQIQRGNSLNAASMVASGQSFSNPEEAGQFVKILAENLLEWLRAE